MRQNEFTSLPNAMPAHVCISMHIWLECVCKRVRLSVCVRSYKYTYKWNSLYVCVRGGRLCV